ncbi:MAG: nitroreductase family protein [Lachnospiraceae bacterium]|nr:nitroreductase family protein [Lachnospiraceae bacterium]
MIEKRRSIRKYTDTPVSKDQIEQIVKAATLAPSAKNRQPWKYLVYTKEAKRQLLDVMEAGLMKEQQDHALLPKSAFGLPDAFHTLQIMREAPVVIIVMNTNGGSPYEAVDADQRLAEICDSLSIGAAIENMILKATELGLGTLWITNTCFAYDAMVAFIQSPGQLIGAVTLGYAAEDPLPRPRKAMNEVLEYR